MIEKNTSFVDILPLVAANALQITLVICSNVEQNIRNCRIVHPVERKAASNIPYVVLHYKHEHYSSTVPDSCGISDVK